MSDQNQNPNPATGDDKSSATEGKVFSSDYVHSLREEAKAERIKAKNYETHLREAMGIDSTVDLSDLPKVVKNFKESTAKMIQDAMASANSTLIRAEVKSLGSDYNAKLVEKLLDRSKLTIENGEVKGLKEALVELEKEFPEIKKTKDPRDPGSNPAGTRSKPKDGEEYTAYAQSLI